MRCFNLYQARFAAKLAYFAAKFSTVVRLARVNLNFLGPENVRKCEVSICCRPDLQFQLPGRTSQRKFLQLQGFGFNCLPPICREFLSQGLCFNCLGLNLQEVFCCRDSGFNCLPWICMEVFCCKVFCFNCLAWILQETFVAGRDSGFNCLARICRAFLLQGLCFHCLARICREFLSQGLCFNGFNCLVGFAGSFCCRGLLPLPGPDPQGVSVAGIVLHLPWAGSAGFFVAVTWFQPSGRICRKFLWQGFWFELPAPDLQDVFVAGILFQLAGLHQLVDLRNQELKGYTACAQIL